MFSALSSLIWGSEQEVPANETKNIDEHVEVENEWIYIQPKGKNIDQIESRLDRALLTFCFRFHSFQV